MLQPICIDGVLERINPCDVVKDILFDKGFPCTGNCRRRGEIILVHHGFGGEVLFSGRHGVEETYLGVGKCLSHRVKHKAELGGYRRVGILYGVKRGNRIGAEPYLLGELLDIVRMILNT